MTVRVPWLIALALLAATAWLLWPTPGPEDARASARDAAEDTRAPGLRGAGAPRLAARGLPPTQPVQDEPLAEAPAEAPTTGAVLTGLPLHVRLVEAETGRAADAPWALRHGHGLKVGGVPVAPIAAYRDASEDRRPTAYPAGVDGAIGLAVRPAEGSRLVAWDRGLWKVRVSAYATSLEAVYPLRAEARVRVIATTHDGKATDRFAVQGYHVAGRYVGEDVRTTAAARGRYVHGIPYFRRQPVEVLAVQLRKGEDEPPELCADIECEAIAEAWDLDADDEILDDLAFPDYFEDAATGRGRFPDTPHEPLILRVRFGKDPEEGLLWGGAGSGFFRGRSCGRRQTPTAHVELTVLRQDGRPAAGARVAYRGSVRRADADGHVRFDNVPAGNGYAELREPGLVSTRLVLDAPAGHTVRGVLREAQGGTVVARVLAHDGEPAPYATVQLSKWAYWADVSHGVQRVDPFVDERGERVLDRVPSGPRDIKASWAGLTRTTKVEVRDGARTYVTITLPKPSE